MKEKEIMYIDMDGVIADFSQAINDIDPEVDMSETEEAFELRSKTVDEIVETHPRLFEFLEPIDGGIQAVNELFDLYDVYFLSTPMWNVPESFMGKRLWLEKYFGDKAKKRLILTHRKDLAIGKYLIDDRLKNGAGEFTGEHIHFGTEKFPNWKSVLKYLKK